VIFDLEGVRSNDVLHTLLGHLPRSTPLAKFVFDPHEDRRYDWRLEGYDHHGQIDLIADIHKPKRDKILKLMHEKTVLSKVCV
jgi:hypothetical protein